VGFIENGLYAVYAFWDDNYIFDIAVSYVLEPNGHFMLKIDLDVHDGFVSSN
jgi:hypothetical protein